MKTIHTVLVLTCFLVLAGGVSSRALPLTGRVVDDRNGDGAAGPGEPGIGGVLVSDGLTVCRTDAQGGYRLDTPALPALLRVSAPRDYRPEGDFWRWAKGDGGEDFLLVSQPQADSFFFAQMTDSHLGRVDLFKQFVTRLNDFPVPLAFVVNTGDLVGGVDVVPVDKAMDQFKRYQDGISGLKPPLFNLPGNHEHVAFHVKEADQSDPRYGKGLYRQVFGPMHYSWNWGPYHFIALDGTTLPYQEKLGDEQLAWLKADLDLTPPETPLILFCHQSLPALRDAASLKEALAGRNVTAAFCGHLHETSVKALGDIPVYHTGALSGSWWGGANPDGTPQGFGLIKLDKDGVHYAYSSREGTNSLYVSSPNATKIRSGRMEMEAVVLDFGDDVPLSAEAGGQIFDISRKERGAFWSVWQGTVDTAPLPDGLMTVKVISGTGDNATATEARFLVLNGNEQAYHADAEAVLKLRVRGVDADDEVWLGEQRLGVIPAGTPNDTNVAFTLAPEALKRVNRVVVRAGTAPGAKDRDDFSVGPVWLEYKGKRIHDIRYVSFARHSIGDNAPKRYGPEQTFYLCLP